MILWVLIDIKVYIPTRTVLVRAVTNYQWSNGSILDHISLAPVFESWSWHIWRLFHLWLRFITFGDCSAHLAYHAHKSGHKILIIIIIIIILQSSQVKKAIKHSGCHPSSKLMVVPINRVQRTNSLLRNLKCLRGARRNVQLDAWNQEWRNVACIRSWRPWCILIGMISYERLTSVDSRLLWTSVVSVLL